MSTYAIPQFGAHHRMALALDEARITPIEMAGRLGIAKNTVYSYMAGTRKPKLGMVMSWAAVCGVPWEWIVSGEMPEEDSDSLVRKRSFRLALVSG